MISLGFLGLCGMTAAVYALVPSPWILLGASLGWMVWQGGWLVLLPLTGAAVSYSSALKGKWKLCLLVLFGQLLVCKVLLTAEVLPVLPLGISFFTFQAAGYVLDVHRKKIRPEPNFFRLLLFLTFFPQLVQGPINRYPGFSAQFGKKPCREDFRAGLERMTWGYFKKLVIADRIAPAVRILAAGEFGGLGMLLLSLFYCIRIYGDFTGGIDIALGFARMLGIRLPENFRNPFAAESAAEFWRRWHITLGEWMKDYVFYPLSVSAPMRCFSRWSRNTLHNRKLPVYAASCLTWMATGLWHGLTPNFLVWGLLNFAVITAQQELPPLRSRRARIASTFFLMNLIRVCDLHPNVWEFLCRLADFHWQLPTGLLSLPDFLILAIAFPLALHWDSKPRPAWALPLTIFAAILLGSYGVGYAGEAFIYNGF